MKAIWEKALLESPYSSSDIFPQVQTQMSFNEGYEAFIEREKLYVKASSISSLNTAFSQISIASRANEEQNFLGSCSPKYSFRPIWLFGEETLYLKGYPVVSLPKGAKERPGEIAKEIAFALIEAGYQTIVLGDPWLTTEGSLTLDSAQEFLRALKKYGISIYLFLNPCIQEKDPFETFQEKIREHYRIIEQEFNLIDGVMTRSVPKIEYPEIFTYPKRLLMQINSYEELIGDKKLLFYFDFKDAYESEQCGEWMEEILDGVGPKTSLSFSSFIGDMRGQSFKKNAVWKALNDSWDSSTTPIVPLINAGGVDCGEGLWPNSPLTLFHNISSSLHRHPFSGILPFTRYLPLKRGLLRATLWSLGASQWQKQTPEELMELFLKAYFNIKHTHLIKELLHDSEEISHTLQKVQSNPQKESKELALYLKYILSKVDILDFKIKKMPKDHLSYMFKMFVRDVKKKLLLWNQQWQLHINEIASGDDLKESFWIDIEHSSRGGLGGSVQGEQRESPYAPENNQEMQEILQANR